MARRVRIDGLPPLDRLPKPVAEAAQSLLDLRAQAAEIDEEYGRLNPVGSKGPDHPEMVAAREDAALLAEAVRAGRDPAEVGTPHADRLAKERAAVATRRRAIREAIKAAERDLYEALVEHRDACREIADQVVADATEAYTEAIGALEEARSEFNAAVGLARWVERLYDHDPRFVGYGSRGTQTLRVPGSPMVIAPSALFATLRSEIEREAKQRDPAAAGRHSA